VIRFAVLAVGERLELYQQAHGACLSVLGFYPTGCEVAIFTSHPGRFSWLGADPRVRVVPVAEDLLSDWQGPHRYLYRAKLCAARAAAALGPAHVVLLDADTLARRPRGRLGEDLAGGRCVMHTAEKPLDARPATRKAFSRWYGRAFDGFELQPSTLVLNSGLVGIPAEQGEVVEQALRLNDALLETGVDYFAVEQVAWSVVVGRRPPVSFAVDLIDHYWGNKRAYLALVNRLLSEALLSGWSPRQAADAFTRLQVDVPLRVRDRWWHPRLLRFLKIPAP
jgi:hypothetical protein